MSRTAFLLLALAMFTACAGDESQSSDGRESLAIALMEHASDYEREIIEDAVVTFDEYEKSTLDMVACIEGRGVDVFDLRYVEASRQYVFSYGRTDRDAPEAAGLDAIYEDCFEDYQDQVLELYLFVEPVQSAEDEQLLLQEAMECLQENGVDVDPNLTSEDVFDLVSEDIERLGECGSIRSLRERLASSSD